MPKFDLIYIIGSLRVGGCEKHIVSVANYLASNADLNVGIFVICDSGELQSKLHASITTFLPCISYPVNSSKLRKIGFHFLRFINLASICFKARPKVIHSYLPLSYIYGAIAYLLLRPILPFSKLLMSRRSLNHYQSSGSIFKYESILHSIPHLALANSAAIAKDLRSEGFDSNKIRLIYNGVKAYDSEKVTLCSSRPNNIVCVANLIPYKGHIELIRAFSSAFSRLESNDLKLLLVGRPSDSAYYDFLRSLTSELLLEKQISFITDCSEPSSYLLSSRIGILPSRQEGFSNSLLEYMAAKLAIITSSVGGNTEAIIHMKSGLIFPPQDHSMLAENILLLQRNLRLADQLSHQAYLNSLEKFSADSMFEAYTSLYRFLLL
ncbi:putative alpha-galactosyltransferase [Synechococcus sp. BIOS-E4-1]|uniref:glycosyltransferase n=1 Tax=Synechococcus sp. BIOS-E4-1 TaxID=1400864 RepID=UPI0016491133|nr:glycosyltransferase [Synechococcus sp. BIOS-E4-1]QNI52879.1 putative alpha-galactosyltransferase [Synechococcus sp. BIOS-E4-1]